jgi:UDP-N-acetylglucosamine:LPS N-acetylglucosamine transferase
MIQQHNILILMSETGGGHVSLAEALRERLQPDYAIRVEDLLPGLIPDMYRHIAQKAPWLWSYMFHMSDTPGLARLTHLMMLPFITPRLLPLLVSFQPDLVLSVHPLLTHTVKRVLEQHASHIPFAMLLSDPASTHATWYTERDAAATFAPTPEMYAQALAKGFDPARLHYVGWPVRRQFASLLDVPREQVIENLNRRQQWDLDPARLTIFAASGAEGAAHLERTARLVLAQSEDAQVILAAGANWALYRRCQGVKRLYAFPFTSEMAPFMAAAHVTMGRCSPNILFESLALGKPLIATSYMPGQEEDNLRFIEQHGLGWVALESAQLRALVEDLESDFSSERSMLNSMRATVQAYQRVNAAANESLVPRIRALVDNADQPGMARPVSSTRAAV